MKMIINKNKGYIDDWERGRGNPGPAKRLQ